MIRTVKKPVRTRVRKRGQNDEYSRGSRSSRDCRVESWRACAGSMSGYVLTCVLLMALVTYIPRVLPVTIFRKQIRSKFIRSFLDYTPYAVLGALTFPDVFTSTGHLYSAVGGTIVAVILGYKGKSLVVVAIAAIVTVYLLEMAGGAGLLASLSF